MKISVSREKSTNELKTLRKIPCTTGHDGSYAFSVTPAEAAEPSLYITLQVTPRDHVNFKDGYSFDIILRNEKLGKRPFFENVRLSPCKEVEGIVQTPDGKPAAGVKVDAWSSPDANQPFYNNGRFSRDYNRFPWPLSSCSLSEGDGRHLDAPRGIMPLRPMA